MLSMSCRKPRALGLLASFGLAVSAQALTFSDSFDSSPSPLWRNEVGSWSVSGGTYGAVSPSNRPNASSSLGLASLSDFTIELDLIQPADGGVWLRSAAATGTTVGRTGILLVSAGGNLYWHAVTDGSSEGSALNMASSVFTVGSASEHLKVVVSGNQYSAYLNGSATATTTLLDTHFTSGDLALYSNSSQRFDNVSVQTAVPEPAAASVFGAVLAGGFAVRQRMLGRGRKNGGSPESIGAIAAVTGVGGQV